MTKIETDISRCIIKFVVKEPFYGHLLAGVQRQVTEQVPTMSVSIHNHLPLLRIHPDFFAKKLTTQSQRIAVIKHEILHIIFKHIFRTIPAEYPFIFNIAADISVNQYIGQWELPKSAVTLHSIPGLVLPPGQTVEYYYKQLLNLYRKKTIIFDKILKKMESNGVHYGWGIDQEESHLADAIFDSLIFKTKNRTSHRGLSDLPQAIQEIIAIALKKYQPALDWKRVVRIFTSSGKRSRLRNTLKRPSKRYQTFPGNKVQSMQKLVLAVDTSGSISDDDLSRIFSEIHAVWRQGAEITVLECDCQIGKIYSYNGVFPKIISGRGGTSFQPVFEWLKRNRREKWDGCIYLTDGFAQLPDVGPPCKLLWIVTAGGCKKNLKFGRAIQLPHDKSS